VNNAGIMTIGTVEQLSIKQWQLMIDINLLGMVRGVRAFLPGMLERGSGYIVNTSSIGGLIAGRVTSVSYTTTKFAVTAFTEVLYKQLKPKGIGVSLLCPGGVDTEGAKHVRFAGKEEARSTADMSRIKSPDEIASILVEGMNKGEFLILADPPRFRALMLKRAQDTQGFLDYLDSRLNDPTKSG
jgi:NADP-dependent 3-hydroxy acid dehydrogenase YdfG